MDTAPYPILVVDDEQSVVSALKRELKSVAPVLTALSPDEAKKILTSQTVALVISDYKMPGKDGVTFLSELKDLSYEPVKILLTAFSETEIVIDAVNRAGVFYFLRKPWNATELQVLVKRALEVFSYSSELKLCKQRLEEIERIKKGITGILSHELNTPLTAISGYTDLLDKTVKDERSRELVKNLRTNVERLDNFVAETVEIAKIEAGQFKQNKEKIDLSGIIDKHVPSLKVPKGICIEADRMLITDTFKKIATYIILRGCVLNSSSTVDNGYLMLNFTVPDSIQPLFENMEMNTDFMNYGGYSNIDMVYAYFALKACGANMISTKVNDGVRVEIIFKGILC